MLDYRDSGMAGAPENDDPRAFVQASESRVVGELVDLMRRHRPQVVVTFDENGGYGHPDHIFISKTTTAAFKESGNPKFKSSGELDPWTPLKLYYMAFPRSRIQRFVEEYRRMKPDNEISEIDPETLGVPDDKFTTQLQVADYVPVRREAAAQHRSQGSPFDMFPESMHEDVFSIDHLILVDPEPAPNLAETDLFEGI
jgi:LmbE family N-acetylglucosaminyl deacetylase